MKSNHIVFTTIYEPAVLIDIQKNLARHGHLDDTVCWVVGDYKTPASCADICQRISKSGLEVRYLDIEAQDKWGKKFPVFYERIPYNNETRRNIGYLHAMESGCKRLISIDDDNYPTDYDFIGGHLKTGNSWDGNVITEPTGYYNICEHLSIEPDGLIFPRGFPFALRGNKNNSEFIPAEQDTLIGVTSGLWTSAPDVDATTWLNGKVESISYNGPSSLVLSQNTWSPINTQNTSIDSKLIPAFFCIPMGYQVPGGKIQRYGDIWGGYFLQALIADTPYHICFGSPIVEHRRNSHNYLDDLRHEYWGIILTDWLLSQLRDSFKPTSISIVDRVVELSAFMAEISTSKLPAWCPIEVQNFLTETAKTLHFWSQVCRQIIG